MFRKPASSYAAKPVRLALLAALGSVGVSSLEATPALACGPCVGPELWSIEVANDELLVVANFGLLTRNEDAWRLTCEEAIGGLLLEVQANSHQTLLSTDTGLFVQTGDICEWGPGAASESNSWFLDFATAQSGVDETTVAFALVSNRQTQDLVVERSQDGEPFEIIKTLEPTTAYRKLVAGGDPSALFVSGYTTDGGVWNVAFSLDGGESWDDASPDIDHDYATLLLRAVDPQHPEAVFIEVQTTAGQPDELWRFDAVSGETQQLLVLDGDELFSGLTFDNDSIWVAGRRRGAGSLYQADRSELLFTRTMSDGPEFACLTAWQGELYACVNSFTYNSEFVVGRSTDEGKSWQPEMTIDDLGVVDSCGIECTSTVDWLHGAYGVGQADAGAGSKDSGSSPATPPGDAGVGGAAADTMPKPEVDPARQSDGGCSMTATSGNRVAGWPFALVGLLFLRRKRKRSMGAAALTLLLGCSTANEAKEQQSSEHGEHKQLDAGDPSPHDAQVSDARVSTDCDDRGDQLQDLQVSGDGISLRMLEFEPQPAAVGDNDWLIALSDDEDKPIVGAEDDIFVTPFMPVHGHGTPVAVGVAEVTDGEYRLSPVNTFMPGLWQITLELEGDGPAGAVVFSVCVQ